MEDQTSTTEILVMENASTSEIVREAFDEAKKLVRIEVELAKTEVQKEILQAKKAAIGFGIAAGASLLCVSMLLVALIGPIILCSPAARLPLLVALVFAFGGTGWAALGIALALFIIAGIAALAGYSVLPKKPLEHTRHRLESDVEQLKEHIA